MAGGAERRQEGEEPLHGVGVLSPWHDSVTFAESQDPRICLGSGTCAAGDFEWTGSEDGGSPGAVTVL